MKKIAQIVSLLGVLCLTGCSNVSQSDYDALVAERNTLLQENKANKIVSATVHGSFVATVRSIIPSYTLDQTTPMVAVVTTFQNEPFTVFLGEDLITQVEPEKTYVFEIKEQEVNVTQQEFEEGAIIASPQLAIETHRLHISSIREAKTDEMGHQSSQMKYSIK